MSVIFAEYCLYRIFTDLAFSFTGKIRGGPAKAAVLSSAIMGSINGSAVANGNYWYIYYTTVRKRLVILQSKQVLLRLQLLQW